MIRYEAPRSFILYDPRGVAPVLTEAKAAALSLRTIPYQRDWVQELQRIELKMEIAGTSRIEGGDFTEHELDAVLRGTKENPEQLLTRSQRQAFAALQTYEWIKQIPDDRPVTSDLIREIHRHIVTGADDDHCPPGELRGPDQNVTFGTPRHRGVEGGAPCAEALDRIAQAITKEFRNHDPLVQALAAHYHLAAMHPFLDGNGRTARALEALLLQRAGLRDTCFIAMSNYYYDEKTSYLNALAATRAAGHSLDPFLAFGLQGIARQVHRLLTSIQLAMRKALFRGMAIDLFGRLKTKRTLVIAERQLEILKVLLERNGRVPLESVRRALWSEHYERLKRPLPAFHRDLNNLLHLEAIRLHRSADGPELEPNLEWPTLMTEKAFFRKLRDLPKAKTRSLLG